MSDLLPIPSLPDIIIEPLVRLALAEDFGRGGDITTDAVIPSDARMRAPWDPASDTLAASSASSLMPRRSARAATLAHHRQSSRGRQGRCGTVRRRP